MGCGKSTVGRELHQRLGYPLVDMDQVIEERAGKPITAIFADDGEAAFRDMETALLRELNDPDAPRRIISTGGGVVGRAGKPGTAQGAGLRRLAARTSGGDSGADRQEPQPPAAAHRGSRRQNPDPDGGTRAALSGNRPSQARHRRPRAATRSRPGFSNAPATFSPTAHEPDRKHRSKHGPPSSDSTIAGSPAPAKRPTPRHFREWIADGQTRRHGLAGAHARTPLRSARSAAGLQIADLPGDELFSRRDPVSRRPSRRLPDRPLRLERRLP